MQGLWLGLGLGAGLSWINAWFSAYDKITVPATWHTLRTSYLSCHVALYEVLVHTSHRRTYDILHTLLFSKSVRHDFLVEFRQTIRCNEDKHDSFHAPDRIVSAWNDRIFRWHHSWHLRSFLGWWWVICNLGNEWKGQGKECEHVRTWYEKWGVLERQI